MIEPRRRKGQEEEEVGVLRDVSGANPKIFAAVADFALQMIEKCYKLEANNYGTDNGVCL